MRMARADAIETCILPGSSHRHAGAGPSPRPARGDGRRVRPPVFLARRPVEPLDKELQAFYRNLLAAVKESGLCEGEWQLCDRSGWPDNSSYLNLVAWCWSQGGPPYLVVVNLSEYQSQAQVHVPWGNLAGRTWRLTDVLFGDVFDRNGDEMISTGLYVDLPAWRCYFLSFQSA